MRTFLILDDLFFMPFIRHYIAGQPDTVVVAHSREGLTLVAEDQAEVIVCKDLTRPALFETLSPILSDRFIFCFSDNKKLKRSISALRSRCREVPAVVIGKTREGLKDLEQAENTVLFSARDLVERQFADLWSKIDNRKRVERLHRIGKAAENVLILVQNDPDPDAIASGLALRVLLGRNKQTAPIGTFGQVTRIENLNMVRLLDIPLMTVDMDTLKGFSRIAMVDVQPAYFKDYGIRPDIVVDHHPEGDQAGAGFSDIRASYGATSTILGEYLMDADYKITQRLATALVYGIKTDTMFLGRGITRADIKMFTRFYPLANINMIRQIEHATLDYDAIGSFVKALQAVTVVDHMLFSFVGRVEAEDIIPRLADFCLQIGGSEWAFVTGISGSDIVCCVRNVGYVKHSGDIVGSLFGDIGSAGGHRSMAKAVIPLRNFKKKFGVSRRQEINQTMVDLMVKAVKES